ncbi:FMRFamide receptor [Orchesella cincta]|uniref:FMRFamide receptor n=1 Tax=Orchesella cincta TaxID=48709 RepID=A0A1D2M1W9_ORCCI|nr:FMRFamide receptor [Orchesella cincta]
MANFTVFNTIINILVTILFHASAETHYETHHKNQNDRHELYQRHRHFNGHFWPVLKELNLTGEKIGTVNAESWEASFKDSSRFWVHYSILPGVVLVGVLGNSVTIHILSRKPMRSSTNVGVKSLLYLTALAITDIVYLLFSFSMSWRHFPIVKNIWLYWLYSPFGLWVTDASSKKAKNAICCTEKRAFGVSIVVCIICFALTSTTPFEWRATAEVEEFEEYNETLYSLESTEFGSNNAYRLFYHWFTTITFVLLPLVILGILNFFLIRAVRSSSRERMLMLGENLASILKLLTSRVENRVTVTLISVVILFLICQMPTALVLVYTSIHVPERDSKENSVLLGLGNIFNLLVAFNAASNFLLYTALCDKYRKQFCTFFCLGKEFAAGAY